MTDSQHGWSKVTKVQREGDGHNDGRGYVLQLEISNTEPVCIRGEQRAPQNTTPENAGNRFRESVFSGVPRSRVLFLSLLYGPRKHTRKRNTPPERSLRPPEPGPQKVEKKAIPTSTVTYLDDVTLVARRTG